jgi:hypothetical protein
MLGWVVVWYYAPHHIGGGIVCSLLLIVCLGAHSWQCPLALALGMCACALAHGIVSSLRSLTAARARLYMASCACAAVTTQRCCCTNCTSCHMQKQWNHRKIKQNSDVFLDLFWLIFRLPKIPKTLVLFLHTTKVPEATREKSAPNKQTILIYIRCAIKMRN